jgi:hypothetical protein
VPIGSPSSRPDRLSGPLFQTATMTEAEFVQAQVHEAWQQGREATKIQDGQIPQTKHITKVSP